MKKSGRLFGVRALVFGASSGIGEAIARTYCKHDAQVLAVDVPQGNFERDFASVPGAIVLPLPKVDDDICAGAVDTAVAELGGLDVVVNSFGIQPLQPFGDEVTLQKYQAARLKRTRRIFDAAWPHLQKSPGGRVIVIGCMRSAFKLNSGGLFAKIEEAMAAQTRELAAMSGQFGVTVNYIQPGAVMTAESRRIFVNDKALRDYCIGMSAARRIGDPIDVAKVALFLATDDAAFVSGTGIRVDGGAAGDAARH